MFSPDLSPLGEVGRAQKGIEEPVSALKVSSWFLAIMFHCKAFVIGVLLERSEEVMT